MEVSRAWLKANNKATFGFSQISPVMRNYFVSVPRCLLCTLILAGHHRVDPLFGKHRERLPEVTFGAGVHDIQPQSDAVRGGLGLLGLRLGLRRVGRIDQQSNRCRGGQQFVQQLDVLRPEVAAGEHADLGEIAARAARGAPPPMTAAGRRTSSAANPARRS